MSATYPSFPQLVGSTQEFLDDVVVDQAVNGAVKVRGFFSGRKSRFVLKHHLVATDLATLLAFYDANRLLTVAMTWALDGNAYTCLFNGAPKVSPGDGTGSDVMVGLVQQ